MPLTSVNQLIRVKIFTDAFSYLYYWLTDSKDFIYAFFFFPSGQQFQYFLCDQRFILGDQLIHSSLFLLLVPNGCNHEVCETLPVGSRNGEDSHRDREERVTGPRAPIL